MQRHPDSIRPNPVREALRQCRPHLIGAAAFSAVSNLLYLVPSIYMMQVYDRVVPTGGVMTLVALSVVTLLGLGALSALEWLRARLTIRASVRLDRVLAGPTLHSLTMQPTLTRAQRAEAMREFDTLRQAVASPALIAMLDLPWFPIYVIATFLLHPSLGLLTTAAALILMGLAWSNERAIREPLSTAHGASATAQARQLHSAAHAAEIRALGMGSALTRLHLSERAEANRLQTRAGFASGLHGSVVKFLRLTFQSAALGVGALLVVRGQLSAGSMIAATLLLSRALAPIEQIVGAWKPILAARGAYLTLCELFQTQPARMHTELPAPTGTIAVERLSVTTPQGERVALADVSFTIAAGEIIGIVGHSGAGKSSLLRALAGTEPPLRGTIRLDSASTLDWDGERLAQHLGYLPQNFVLFAGSVRDNIARFQGQLGGDASALDAAVIEAARMAGAHDMILRLPQGYDTPIGGGVGLSAGQAQRVAIARALFGRPQILLLDEPTAHLDTDGQHDFIRTLSQLRVEGRTVLFATHSADILASTDKLLLLRDGQLERLAPLADAALPLRHPVSHNHAKAMQ